jgi:hypothetical protein
MAGSRTPGPPAGWSKKADLVASCRTAASPDRLSACIAAAWRFPFFLSVCQDTEIGRPRVGNVENKIQFQVVVERGQTRKQIAEYELVAHRNDISSTKLQVRVTERPCLDGLLSSERGMALVMPIDVWPSCHVMLDAVKASESVLVTYGAGTAPQRSLFVIVLNAAVGWTNLLWRITGHRRCSHLLRVTLKPKIALNKRGLKAVIPALGALNIISHFSCAFLDTNTGAFIQYARDCWQRGLHTFYGYHDTHPGPGICPRAVPTAAALEEQPSFPRLRLASSAARQLQTTGSRSARRPAGCLPASQRRRRWRK